LDNEKVPVAQVPLKLGMKSLHGNADNKIVVKLHDELLLKAFHAEIATEVKNYKESKSKKM
jgi:hypothetical protein